MAQLIATPRKDPAQDGHKKSTLIDFLRRLAFWKAAKQDEMDRLFTEAVSDLHPEWEKRRLADKLLAANQSVLDEDSLLLRKLRH